MVGAAFKAVEVRLRAWWVRLLPLPPTTPIYGRFRGSDRFRGPICGKKVLNDENDEAVAYAFVLHTFVELSRVFMLSIAAYR